MTREGASLKHAQHQPPAARWLIPSEVVEEIVDLMLNSLGYNRGLVLTRMRFHYLTSDRPCIRHDCVDPLTQGCAHCHCPIRPFRLGFAAWIKAPGLRSLFRGRAQSSASFKGVRGLRPDPDPQYSESSGHREAWANANRLDMPAAPGPGAGLRHCHPRPSRSKHPAPIVRRRAVGLGQDLPEGQVVPSLIGRLDVDRHTDP